MVSKGKTNRCFGKTNKKGIGSVSINCTNCKYPKDTMLTLNRKIKLTITLQSE